MTLIHWLDELSKDDAGRVGSKAANLGELINQELPVPYGFVITPTAFKVFLEAKGLKENVDQLIYLLKIGNKEKIEETNKNVQNQILQSELPGTLKKEIIDAYKKLSLSNLITDQKALDLISAGRDLAVVAIRSSFIPEQSKLVEHTNFLNIKG